MSLGASAVIFEYNLLVESKLFTDPLVTARHVKAILKLKINNKPQSPLLAESCGIIANSM